MSHQKAHIKKRDEHSDNIKVKGIVLQEQETQIIPDNRVTQIDVGNGRSRYMKFYSDKIPSNNKKIIK